MAESERGPIVALHNNSLCLQYNLDLKYKETIRIFKNFVEEKI